MTLAEQIARFEAEIGQLARERDAAIEACRSVLKAARKNHPGFGGGWYLSLSDADMEAVRVAAGLPRSGDHS